MKSELDLFLVPPTNRIVEEGGWASVFPTVAVAGKSGPIEFRVIPSEKEYIALNKCEFYMRVSLKKETAGVLATLKATDACAPINNIMHSLFSQVEIAFNNVGFETSNDTYPYKSYIIDLLNSTAGAKNSLLQSQGFYPDAAGQFDSLKLPTETIDDNKRVILDGTNSGFLARRDLFINDDGVAEFIGNLNLDIFKTNRYLLNNVEMRVKLTRSSNDFALLHAKTEKYVINIDHIEMRVRKCRIDNEIINAHNLVLEGANAKYPIRRTVVKPFTIAPGLPSIVIDNINQGVLPIRVVLGFVESESYNGLAEKNPFDFQHFNIKKLVLKISGQEVVYYNSLHLDFAKGQYLNAYNTLFQNIDGPTASLGNQISRKDYPKGNALFAFDLTADLDSSDTFHMLKSGNLQIQIEWAKTTEKAITLLVFMEYDNLVEITKNRSVHLDYST